MVLAAEDLRLDRQVAIKVVHCGDPTAGEVKAKFELEARLVARLVHPHVVAVFDSGEEDR